jgi:hypothetical protein
MDTTDTDKSASYLDIHLEIDSEGRLRTKRYDNRDDLNFPIVNFPGGDRNTFEVMTSTYLRGTLGSVASLLAAMLYQGNLDRNHKLWNIISTEIYILHMQVLFECSYI